MTATALIGGRRMLFGEWSPQEVATAIVVVLTGMGTAFIAFLVALLNADKRYKIFHRLSEAFRAVFQPQPPEPLVIKQLKDLMDERQRRHAADMQDVRVQVAADKAELNKKIADQATAFHALEVRHDECQREHAATQFQYRMLVEAHRRLIAFVRKVHPDADLDSGAYTPPAKVQLNPKVDRFPLEGLRDEPPPAGGD